MLDDGTGSAVPTPPGMLTNSLSNAMSNIPVRLEQDAGVSLPSLPLPHSSNTMMGLGVQPIIASQPCMAVPGMGGLMVQNGFGNQADVVPPYVVLPGITVATMTRLLANSVSALQSNAAYRSGLQMPGIGISGVPVGVGSGSGGVGGGGFLLNPSLPASSASILSQHEELSMQLKQADGAGEKNMPLRPVPTMGTVWSQTNLGISTPSAKREHEVDQNVPCKMPTSMDDGSLDKAEGDQGGWSTHNMRLLSKVCEEIEKSSFSAVYASKAKKIPYKQHAMGSVDAPDAPSYDDWMELQAEREAVGVQEEEGSRPLMSSSGYKTKEPSIAELCNQSEEEEEEEEPQGGVASFSNSVKRKNNPQDKDHRCDTVGKKLDEDLDRAILEKDPKVIKELQAKLAAEHGLSVKTIREIWNRRTRPKKAPRLMLNKQTPDNIAELIQLPQYSGRRKPWKVSLSAEDARDIFRQRPLIYQGHFTRDVSETGAPLGPDGSEDKDGEAAGGTAEMTGAALSRKYGISAKAVRDIWNRNTWVRATRDLWTKEEKEEGAPQRRRTDNKIIRAAASHLREVDAAEALSHTIDQQLQARVLAEAVAKQNLEIIKAAAELSRNV
mmetsp:Transcript_46309/g.145291  ORF Transcript_46309/g.145291 Transcript_46309/m.145291 type:complete len:609 (-) Transcript_46309:104-1930(-)